MLKLIRSLIEGGYVGQTILLIIVWGTIAYLYANGQPVPDSLLIAGSTILGWFFRSTGQSVADRRAKLAAHH